MLGRSRVVQIGNPPWTRSEMLGALDDFARLYANRPIQDNQGGMKAPHMFAVWFMVSRLSPDLIVESGVFKGQSTWLLEQACPTAELVCIDVFLGRREYISRTASYSDRDFGEHDWSRVTDRSLVFFDDHQDAYKRLQLCRWFGFKHVIFEDNYPLARGDCYSLKQAFSGTGSYAAPLRKTTSSHGISRRLLRRLARSRRSDEIAQPSHGGAQGDNDFHALFLYNNLQVYYEFPPVLKTQQTRWGDEWSDSAYPTPEPLLDGPTKPGHAAFLAEALSYTWICYARLR
jgi:hypothetical protein